MTELPSAGGTADSRGPDEDESSLPLWDRAVVHRFKPPRASARAAVRAAMDAFEPESTAIPSPPRFRAVLLLYSAVLLQFLPWQRMNPFLAVWALALPWTAILRAKGARRAGIFALFAAGLAVPAGAASPASPTAEGLRVVLATGSLLLGLFASRGGNERTRALPLLAAAAGLLLAIGPDASVPLVPLAWIAPVPLTLFALEPEPLRRRLGGAYLASAAGFAAAFGWVHHTSPWGVGAIGLYLGIYGALFVLAVGPLAVRGGVPLCLAVPLVLVPLDWLRGHLFGGIPWFQLGHATIPWLPFVQAADVAGAHGITAIVAFGAGAVADAAVRGRWGWTVGDILTSPRTVVPLAASALAVAAAWGYGTVRIPAVRAAARPGPRLHLVQADIPQDLKHDPGDRRDLYDRHAELTARGRGRADLVVWAETMFPWALPYDAARGTWPDPAGMDDPAWGPAWDRLRNVAGIAGAPCVIGAIVREGASGIGSGEARWYNSAVFVDAAGAVGPRYDKIHLVPGSESIPFRGRFGWLDRLFNRLAGVELEPLTPGAGPLLLPLGETRFGVMICYESIFPGLVREYAERGAGFLLNISNDGWFRESQELDQMLDLTALRAIECRIGIVRATNTGISAFIAPTGETEAVLESGGRRKSVAGTLTRAVSLGPGGSLYARAGDWLPAVLTAGAIGALGFSLRRKRAG